MIRELHSQSPYGAFAIEVSAWEAKMSLWVESPILVERARGTQLFSFADEAWSLIQAHWLDHVRVNLSLRKYPGNHVPSKVDVLIDCNAQIAEVQSQILCALRDLESVLNRSIC